MMYVLILAAFINGSDCQRLRCLGSFHVKPVKAFEEMQQCREAAASIVDKYFTHCIIVEDKKEEKQEENNT